MFWGIVIGAVGMLVVQVILLGILIALAKPNRRWDRDERG